MELDKGIMKVLDGNGVLFLGSGFSLGGLNRNSESIKSGKGLSHLICNEIGINETDDLTISSERYLEDESCKKSLGEFISFLSDELICVSVTEDQKMISDLPWKRIYTTNYDNAFEVASKNVRKIRTSITMTNKRYSPLLNLDEAIIHINGNIIGIDESLFYDEFKITDSSYNKSGLLESEWKGLFDSDLTISDVIVFIGYSLQYDQELVRHIANLNVQDKCIFIDTVDISEDSEFRIKRYGSLEKIGMEGFSQRICEIKKNYVPKHVAETLRGFSKRTKDMYYSNIRYSPIDIVDFYVHGNINMKYINQKGYCVQRTEKIEEVKKLLESKKVIVIESKLGNGKSVFLEIFANAILDKYDVYFVDSLDYMNDNLNYIFRCFDKKILLLIDDYNNYIPLLRSLGESLGDNIKIVMTCRTSINGNLYYDLIEKYNYNIDDLQIVNIDEMNNAELTLAVSVFDINRLWGRYDTYSTYQKKKMLQRNYNAQISNMFYVIVESDIIRKNIQSVVNIIRAKKGLFDFILAQAINKICGLKFSYYELLEYIEITDTLIRSYMASDRNVVEVIDENNHHFIIGSTLYSLFLVKEANMHENMLKMLAKLFEKCSVNDNTIGRHLHQRRTMVSRSNLILLINDGRNEKSIDENAVLNYYDAIKHLPTATSNPYFWLQYGITALNLDLFELADTYFENAYANANQINDFDTFQIDTHRARLLLCAEMHRNKNDKYQAIETFKQAHKLLINNKNHGERLRYVLRQVEHYEEYYIYYKAIMDENERDEFLRMALEMNEKFLQYFRLMDSGKIPNEVSVAYIRFNRMFSNTIYVAELKNTNEIYNKKVTNKRYKV